MAKSADRPDPKALFGKFTLSKRGRTRAVQYKSPRDRLLDSLANQLEIVELLKAGRVPKEEGRKARKMFFPEGDSYVVQVKYNNEPLNITPDADAIQVNTLNEVAEVLNGAITLANAGHFDEQVSRIAAAWSETRRGRRGPQSLSGKCPVVHHVVRAALEKAQYLGVGRTFRTGSQELAREPAEEPA